MSNSTKKDKTKKDFFLEIKKKIVKILKIYGKSGKLLAEAKNTNTETKTLEKKVENKTTAKK